jgi:hypothetical protein
MSMKNSNDTIGNRTRYAPEYFLWGHLKVKVHWRRDAGLGSWKSTSWTKLESLINVTCLQLCILSANNYRNVWHDRESSYATQLLKNKQHTLNGILLLILHNLCVPYIQTDSPEQRYENRHMLLLSPLTTFNKIRPNQLYIEKIWPLIFWYQKSQDEFVYHKQCNIRRFSVVSHVYGYSSRLGTQKVQSDKENCRLIKLHRILVYKTKHKCDFWVKDGPSLPSSINFFIINVWAKVNRASA